MSHAGSTLVVADQYFVAADSQLQLEAAGFECVGLAATADDALEASDS